MSGAVMVPLNEICAKFPLLTNVVDFRVGGQKSVYRATHPTYGEIALKLISPQTQFERMPEIYETGYVDFLGGKIFFMLEQFVNGVSLREKYGTPNAQVKMTKDDAVDFLGTMLDVIVKLEHEHIIHRDIKPENILVGDDGKYWLIDFGAARDMDGSTLTMTGKCAPLTPGYAAPEQFKAELKRQLDSRADLFALGVTVYELLSGSNPFVRPGYGAYDVLRSTVVETADTLDIPGDERGELQSVFFILAAVDQKSGYPDINRIDRGIDRDVERGLLVDADQEEVRVDEVEEQGIEREEDPTGGVSQRDEGSQLIEFDVEAKEEATAQQQED